MYFVRRGLLPPLRFMRNRLAPPGAASRTTNESPAGDQVHAIKAERWPSCYRELGDFDDPKYFQDDFREGSSGMERCSSIGDA